MSLAIVEIFVPTRREEFETFLLEKFKGYTYAGNRFGAWTDPKDGKVYRDEMLAYHVAVGTDYLTAAQVIAKRAAELWPREKSFWTANVGTATLFPGQGRKDGGHLAP